MKNAQKKSLERQLDSLSENISAALPLVKLKIKEKDGLIKIQLYIEPDQIDTYRHLGLFHRDFLACKSHPNRYNQPDSLDTPCLFCEAKRFKQEVDAKQNDLKKFKLHLQALSKSQNKSPSNRAKLRKLTAAIGTVNGEINTYIKKGFSSVLPDYRKGFTFIDGDSFSYINLQGQTKTVHIDSIYPPIASPDSNPNN